MGDIKESEHGSLLYQVWKKIRCNSYCDEWSKFPVFYEWAMSNGYEIGARIQRSDIARPYGPDNCVLNIPGQDSNFVNLDKKRIDEWNRAVNRIRKHYGMPPLYGTEYGD